MDSESETTRMVSEETLASPATARENGADANGTSNRSNGEETSGMTTPSSSSGGADFTLKIIIIGDTDTGKSCILKRMVQNDFKRAPGRHTIGVEFGSKTILIGGDRVKLQIWDTAGQERFRSVCHSYYRGASGALVVFDVTDEESFDNLPHWLEDARALAGKDVCIVICGNKADLKKERKVELLESSRFAQENNAMFLETSALSGQNINEVFHMCARTIVTKIQNGELRPHGMMSPNSRKIDRETQDDSYSCTGYC